MATPARSKGLMVIKVHGVSIEISWNKVMSALKNRALHFNQERSFSPG